jgi:hypothetical protein
LNASAAATQPRATADGTNARVSYTATGASHEDDRDAIVALWNQGLMGDDAAAIKLDWYYRRNPEGDPDMVLLRCDASSRAVGVGTLALRRMRFGARTVVAGCLADFVVEAEHRSFFPALLLQKTLLARGRADHAVVFGMPNAQSGAILRRAGYRCIGQVVRRSRVLRSRAYLPRWLPGWLGTAVGAVIDAALRAGRSWSALESPDYVCEWRERPGNDFDALWERVAPTGTLIGVRDRAFLAWRFVDNPVQKHRFFVVLSKTERTLVGYAVCHVRNNAMEIADFLFDPSAPGAGKRLFLELSREACRAGHRSLSVEFLGAERHLDGFGTLTRGERPLYAAFDDALELSSASNWYVTNADEDA